MATDPNFMDKLMQALEAKGFGLDALRDLFEARYGVQNAHAIARQNAATAQGNHCPTCEGTVVHVS